MYRIELKPGEENVFRTIEELATGIRNGLVTPKARIFHNASQKWLPIEFHPHYKKALKMPAAKSGETPAVVVPSAPAPVSIFTPKPSPAPVFTPPPLAALGPVALAPIPVAPAPATPVPAKAPVVLAPVVAAPAVAAPAVVSPVVGLPRIAYDRPFLEDVPLPVAHAPLGRAGAGRFRPLHLGLAAALLIVASYMALSGAAPSRKAPAAVAADTVASAQSTDSSPASPAASVAAGTSSPTFGSLASPAVEPKHPIVTSIGATPAAHPAKDSAVAIEPAPAEVDLSLPALPSGDSLAPAVKADSNAMRRILRAVGGKGAPIPRP